MFFKCVPSTRSQNTESFIDGSRLVMLLFLVLQMFVFIRGKESLTFKEVRYVSDIPEKWKICQTTIM